MATYCYQCDECYETFESRASMAKAEKLSKGHRVTCPSCGSCDNQIESSASDESLQTIDHECDVRSKDFIRLIIHNTTSEIAQVRAEIVAEGIRRRFSESEVFALTMGLEEALANAYLHGNRQEPDKRIAVKYHINSDEAHIHIIDEGDGFDPALVPDPTDAQHIELSHGRGILIMQSLLDEVHYCRRGTCVRFVKRHNHAAVAGGVVENRNIRGETK